MGSHNSVPRERGFPAALYDELRANLKRGCGIRLRVWTGRVRLDDVYYIRGVGELDAIVKRCEGCRYVTVEVKDKVFWPIRCDYGVHTDHL